MDCEQPGGALMEYFPTWREVVRNIFSVGGPNAVSPLISLSQASADLIIGGFQKGDQGIWNGVCGYPVKHWYW